MLLRKPLAIAVFCGLLLAAGVTRADVFDLGGKRDAATGVWDGLASVEFVTVGDAGNLADPDTTYGAVDHAFQMGKYDVTAGQYCAFLN